MKCLILLALASFVSLAACVGDQDSPTTGVVEAYSFGDPVVFMEDGGWCWYQDPRVVIKGGKLIIGGISGRSGDVRVGVYDLESGSLDGVATLYQELELDDHDAPVFYVRPDNRILAMWAQHGHENFHYYRISEPGNYLAWGELQILTHPFEIPEGSYWGGVTYMNLYGIEETGTLYNFFRYGGDLNPYLATSLDHGSTWQGFTHFLHDEVEGSHRPYVRYAQKDANTISVTFSDAHPRQYGNSLYFAEFDGNQFLRADGSTIKDLAQGPLGTSEAEKIYTGSETTERPEGFGSVPNSAWTIDIENDENGHPYLGYSVFNSADDIRYRIANWDGTEWRDREIAFAGTHLYPEESSYSGLLAIDPDDPRTVVISSDVDPSTGEPTHGQYEIYMGRLDAAETIEWAAFTSDSTHKNIRPVIVTGEGYKVLLWMTGPWENYQDYDSTIVGHVLERPKI